MKRMPQVVNTPRNWSSRAKKGIGFMGRSRTEKVEFIEAESPTWEVLADEFPKIPKVAPKFAC